MATLISPTSASSNPAARRAPIFSFASTSRVRIHNSAVMSTRGEHLVRADRRFAPGGGFIARLSAPAITRVLDEIDRRLKVGGIDAMLPDGSKRRLGFR